MIFPVPPARPGPWTEDGLIDTSSTPARRAAAKAATSPSCLERSYTDRKLPRWGESSRPTVPAASPSDAADDVRTTRGTPARAAALTAASAPRTLTWNSAAGSLGHIVLIPATWKRSAQPSMPAAMASSSSTSPRTVRAPRAVSARSASSERARATTSSPRSTRRASSAPPTNPLPPVTKTRVTSRALRA